MLHGAYIFPSEQLLSSLVELKSLQGDCREILTQSQQWHSWCLRVLSISVLQDWFSRSSKECTIRFRKGVRQYTTVGIRLTGFLTLRPGGEWEVHGVQPSVQHHLPGIYLLVQSRAPSWSRAQVENGSSETRTVRACRRIIRITPSIWLWGEAKMQLCYLPERYQCCRQEHLPQLEENDASFGIMVLLAEKATAGFLWPRHLVNWFWPTGCHGQLQTQGQCGRMTIYSLWRQAGVELHLSKSWGIFTGQRRGNTSHCRTEEAKKAVAISLLHIHGWLAAVTKSSLTTSERQQLSKAVSDAPHWGFLLLHLHLTQTLGMRSLVSLLRAPASHSCWRAEPTLGR